MSNHSMRMRECWRRVTAILLSILPVLPVPAVLAGETETVHIAVASNFSATLRLLTDAFEGGGAHECKTSAASTGKLFAQIAHGAPFDVFLAADAKRPKRLVADGYAVAETLFTYAVGRLALWRAVGAGTDISGGEGILGVRVGRLAIANPKTAPYGKAAEETLRALGLWRSWQSRLARGENIGQTYQFVASGAVDSGFIALSQAPRRHRGMSDRGTMGAPSHGQSGEEIRIVPSSLHTPLWQQAVLLKRGVNNTAARAFLVFLRSPKAREIIEAAGYELPDS
uniref:Molybdate transport system substrate-binding protein n=1 Tax=Candidatus Kentrum sp. SD TaxID=2126332 RepID=A0A451BKK7_9GAMM|nr:MAG: molybdate transport system substrate-binding protein [Candidatus Kentron sp. SD]